MELFGVGLPEIVMICLVALIVLGPERLPEAARTVGKGIADFRRAIEPARSAWTELTGEITSVANTATDAFRAGTPNSGNPYPIHPVLQMMTPEEQAGFIAGGEMPQHVAERLAKQVAPLSANGHATGAAIELPHLDYAMPHSALKFEAAPVPTEDIQYPEPFAAFTPPPESQAGDEHTG